MKQKILVMDTETGGLEAGLHSLLQVGLLVCEDGRVLDELKVNIVEENISDYVVTDMAMKINGINLETHTGYTKEEAVELIIAFVKKHFTKPAQTAGHNVGFDVSFVKMLFKAVGAVYDDVFSYRLLDTSSIARFLIFAGVIPNRGKLGDLANYFGIDFEESKLHDSLVDCHVTYQLLLAMGAMFPQSELAS